MQDSQPLAVHHVNLSQRALAPVSSMPTRLMCLCQFVKEGERYPGNRPAHLNCRCSFGDAIMLIVHDWIVMLGVKTVL